MFTVTRSPQNPLLSPTSEHAWENLATFNPSPIRHNGDTYIYYRASARPDAVAAPGTNLSTIGFARRDACGFSERRQVIVPSEPWDQFGCEDPRATFFEGTWYVFYTALSSVPFGPDSIKVAVAFGSSPDRLTEKRLVTPFNAKAAILLPERIDGDVVLILTAHTDWTEEYPRPTIALARARSIEEFWDPAYWEAWHRNLAAHAIPDVRRTDNDHIEIGGPLLKTDYGWLVIYSYIRDYYDDRRHFGIEALLLDRNDLSRLIGRTEFPFLVPEESYERYGLVSDIVFPTGMLCEGDRLELFYGGADTVVASATFSLAHLISAMRKESRDSFMTRASETPLLSPIPENAWEAKAVFNPAVIDLDGSVHLLYRAMAPDNTSTFGYARLPDGYAVDLRLPEPVYAPRTDAERKGVPPDGNSGCEDPRLSLIDDTLVVTYTAYNGIQPPRGALATIEPKKFPRQQFAWSEPTLLTPEAIGDKDVCFFPEKIDGQYAMIHRIEPNICLSAFTELPPANPANHCIELMGTRRGMWDERKIGAAGPPLRVPEGWLFIYHGIGGDGVYRLGAALLSENGVEIRARTATPILEPVLPWEKKGQVDGVVFSCGAIVRDDTLFLYYGGGDGHIGLATVPMAELMARLTYSHVPAA